MAWPIQYLDYNDVKPFRLNILVFRKLNWFLYELARFANRVGQITNLTIGHSPAIAQLLQVGLDGSIKSSPFHHLLSSFAVSRFIFSSNGSPSSSCASAPT